MVYETRFRTRSGNIWNCVSKEGCREALSQTKVRGKVSTLLVPYFSNSLSRVQSRSLTISVLHLGLSDWVPRHKDWWCDTQKVPSFPLLFLPFMEGSSSVTSVFTCLTPETRGKSPVSVERRQRTPFFISTYTKKHESFKGPTIPFYLQ